MPRKIVLEGPEAEQILVDVQQAIEELVALEKELEWFCSQAVERLEYWEARFEE